MSIMAIGVAALGWVPASALTKAPPTLPPTAHDQAEDTGVDGTLIVSVLPGSLSISSSQTPLTLERMPGNGPSSRYQGVLPRVRVVDTRGSLIGWNASVRFFAPSSLPAEDLRLRVHPKKPIVVSGSPKGIDAAAPVWTTFDVPCALFNAKQGFGAGTYDDEALVELVLPFAGDIASITLEYETIVF